MEDHKDDTYGNLFFGLENRVAIEDGEKTSLSKRRRGRDLLVIT